MYFWCSQGSVLGPVLFTIFTSPVSNIASLHNVYQHQYADDTQLFIFLFPTYFSAKISNLTGCLSALNFWFCINGLALNPDKSNAIVLGTRQRSASYSSFTTVEGAGSDILLSDHIKVLGVTLDKHLTFNDNVNSASRSAFYHIRAMRHIRSALIEDIAKTVACALVKAQLDYANSVLVGVTTKNVTRLQRAQNAVAQVVAWGTNRQSTSSSALLKHYHWFPIYQRIQFKIACITYKTIHTTQPAY